MWSPTASQPGFLRRHVNGRGSTGSSLTLHAERRIVPPIYQDAEKVRQRRSRRAQRLNVPNRVRLASSLAAALQDGLFEHPAQSFSAACYSRGIAETTVARESLFVSCHTWSLG